MSDELAQILLKENLELKYQIAQAKQDKEEISKKFREYRYKIRKDSEKKNKSELERELNVYKNRLEDVKEYLKEKRVIK